MHISTLRCMIPAYDLVDYWGGAGNLLFAFGKDTPPPPAD